MARVDARNKTIHAKIVYYGPGMCGKTANLEYINSKMSTQQLMSLATEGDRTIFFDFMPLDLGKLWGMSVSFKLYTVPGQVRYNQTRKMVLKGADGIVFVADSQRSALDANLESFDNLFSNLQELGMNPRDVVVVLQYNKQDLPNLATREDLDKALNTGGYSTFLASAKTGEGVSDTLKASCAQVLKQLKQSMGKGEQWDEAAGPKPAAAGGKSKTIMGMAAAVVEPAPNANAPHPGVGGVGAAQSAAVAAKPAPKQSAPGVDAVASAALDAAAKTARKPSSPGVDARAVAAAAKAAPRASASGAEAAGVAAVAKDPRKANVSKSVQDLLVASPALGEDPHRSGEVLIQAGVGASRDAAVAARPAEARRAAVGAAGADPNSTARLVPSAVHVINEVSEAAPVRLNPVAHLGRSHDAVTQPISPADAASAMAAAQRSHGPTANASAGTAAGAHAHRSAAEGTDRTDPAVFQIWDRLEQLLSQQQAAQIAELSSKFKQLEASVRSALGDAGSKQAKEPSAGPVSRTDFDSLRAELRAVGVVARGLESVLPSKRELEKLQAMVTKLVEASAPTSGSAGPLPALDGLAKKTDLDDHSQRLLARLPSKNDIQALLKQNAGSGGSSADLGALEQRLTQLPSKAELETLLKQSASTAGKGVDLGALEQRLAQLPSKAELEALLKQSASSAGKGADFGALERRLSQLPSKAELEAVQKRLAELPSRAELEAIQKQLAGLPSKQELKGLQDALAALPSKADLDKLARSVEASAHSAQPSPRRSKPPSKAARADADVKPAVSVAPSAAPHVSEPPSHAEASSEPAPAAAAAKLASAPPQAMPTDEIKEVVAEPKVAAEPAVEAPPEAAAPSAAAEPAVAVEPVVKTEPVAEPATKVAEPSAAPKDDKPDLSADPEHQNAARAARVMASDLLLYHKDDVDGGIKDGDFFERNKEALADMKATYESRVPKHVREHKDYLQEAIDNFIANRRKRLGLG